jgi:hypothetical protein
VWALLAAAILCGVVAANKAGPPERDASPRQVTRRYCLQYVAAVDAARTLRAAFEIPDIRADEASNSVAVVASEAQHGRVGKLLEALDARPASVEIQCELVRIDAEGKRTILSRPTVRTLDEHPTMFSVGQRGGETFEVTLTPKVLADDGAKMAVRVEQDQPKPESK